MRNRHDIVLGTAFGDEAKGLTVANLVTSESLVIRFSGGQQCGHTVIHEDKKHVFSNFGSGTFHGCPTWFTEDTTFYLNSIAIEKEILESKFGISPKLWIHPLAKVTTPYDVIANRIEHEAAGKFSSCGLGVGKTMYRNIHTPLTFYAIDLFLPKSLRNAKLKSVFDYYNNIFGDRWAVMRYADEISFFNEQLQKIDSLFTIRNTTDYDITSCNHFVWEGSQGIMLDMNHGIFPDVTFANTTSKNVWKYINQIESLRYMPTIPDIHLWYITRCYQTRHGRGRMSNYDKIHLINNEEEINKYNKYQGDFKICELDYDLINHSISVDMSYHNIPIYKNLVLSCMDQRPDFEISTDKIFNIDSVYTNSSAKTGFLEKSFDY